jgi:hypothetical protein
LIMKKLLDLVGQSAACNGLLCAGSEGPIVFAPYKPYLCRQQACDSIKSALLCARG